MRLNRCAPPSLRLPSHRRTSTRPCVRPHLLLPRPPRGMLPLPQLLPGKLAASPAQTFHSNRMGPFGVQQGTSWSLMSDVEKSMAVCVSSIPPAFAPAVRVRYVSNVNGTAAQRPNRARSVCCSIHWRWDRLRCFGGTGTNGTSGRHVGVCIANTWRFRLTRSSPSPKPLPLRRSLVLNVRITACHGMSGWRGPARAEMADRITLTLFGIPERVATFLGLATA